MPTPLENAEKRLATLREEVARVERFIADYHAFSTEPDLDRGDFDKANTVQSRSGNVSPETPHQSVDNFREKSGRRKARPDEIAQIMERVIREVGRPMTRGQLVDALERRDVDLPAADKGRYIGTIIWRHKSIFVNIEGFGYWLRAEKRPGYSAIMKEAEIEEEESVDGTADL